jgi:hypothetical protein
MLPGLLVAVLAAAAAASTPEDFLAWAQGQPDAGMKTWACDRPAEFGPPDARVSMTFQWPDNLARHDDTVCDMDARVDPATGTLWYRQRVRSMHLMTLTANPDGRLAHPSALCVDVGGNCDIVGTRICTQGTKVPLPAGCGPLATSATGCGPCNGAMRVVPHERGRAR